MIDKSEEDLIRETFEGSEGKIEAWAHRPNDWYTAFGVFQRGWYAGENYALRDVRQRTKQDEAIDDALRFMSRFFIAALFVLGFLMGARIAYFHPNWVAWLWK